MSKLEKHLRSNEHILWQGKPKFAPFLFGRGLVVSLFGLVFLVFFLFSFLQPILLSGVPLEFVLFLLLFSLVPLLMIFGPFVWGFFAFRNTEYIITDQRVISQSGAIGLDTRFVNLEKIQEVYVNVGVVDRLFGTGSIFAVTAGQTFMGMRQGWGGGGSMAFRPSLSSLERPYEVQKLLQEAIQKVKKSDI